METQNNNIENTENQKTYGSKVFLIALVGLILVLIALKYIIDYFNQ